VTAGPGDEKAASAVGRGHLRASHADREQVVEVLKAAFVQGRLDKDEFDLRVGQALASRTCMELAALTADIPAGLTRARRPKPARESVNKKAVAAVACATAALAGMWHVNPPDGSPFAIPVFVVTLVLLLAAPTGWLLLPAPAFVTSGIKDLFRASRRVISRSDGWLLADDSIWSLRGRLPGLVPSSPASADVAESYTCALTGIFTRSFEDRLRLREH